jgi:uncharacterized protein (TIGR00255 family)
VNHRFLELGVRMPEELRSLEPALRERVGARIARGKIDLTFRLRAPEGGDVLRLDPRLVAQLSELALDLQPRFPSLRVELTELLQFPASCSPRPATPKRCRRRAGAAGHVLTEFVAAREREGAKLAAVIRERVDAIARAPPTCARSCRDPRRPTRRSCRRAWPTCPAAGTRRSSRPMEQELVLWLQKLDVDEELDRLDSHVIEIRRVLDRREPVGRRLTSCCRSSIAKPTRSAPSRSTCAPRRLRSSSRC